MAIFTAIGSLVSAVVTGISAVVGAIGALGTIGQLALGAALTIGANLLLGGSQQRPQAPRFQNRAPQYQAVVNQSTAPRRRGYGRAKLGGTRAFFDSQSGNLYQVIMMHQGQIDGFESFAIGDLTVSRDSSGVVQTSPVGSFARILEYDGSPDQTASPLMVSDWSQWTEDHRLRGIAYVVARFRSPRSSRYLEVFPEGYNSPVTAICRLSRVLDTRTDTTAWSDNPALCIADYLTHPDGYRRLSYDDIDLDSFNAFADLCDEAIPLKDGGTEKRYRLWGAYELNDNPTEVIQRMLATCDGELYTTREGKLAIRGGEWTEPTITIDETQILSHDMEEGADALDRFNQLKIVYTDPSQDFQPTEATPWDDLADQAERGLQTQDFTVDMCPSPSQARRLAKITIAKSNPRWSGTIRTNLAGLRARGERIINLVLPELQIDQTFLVGSHNLILEGGMPVGCEMQVISLSASAYDWDPATEEADNPAIPQDTRPDLTFEVPSGLSLVIEDRGGSLVVVATTDPPAREDADLEAQIRRDGSAIWESMGVASGEMEAVSGALIGSETYFVRARFRTAGAAGGWSDEESIPVVFNSNAPDKPTSFASSEFGGTVSLQWTNPTSNFYRARVYRASGDSAAFGDAILIREILGDSTTDEPGAGTWRYWVTARNAAGLESDPVGPTDETVT